MPSARMRAIPEAPDDPTKARDTGRGPGGAAPDEVNDFQLHYYKVNSAVDQGSWLASTRVIEIKLVLMSNDTPVEFTARVRPRNIERR